MRSKPYDPLQIKSLSIRTLAVGFPLLSGLSDSKLPEFVPVSRTPVRFFSTFHLQTSATRTM
jgi:hypothetical protein